MLNKEMLILIDLHFEEELNAEKQQLFNELYLNNEEFKEEVGLQKLIRNSFNHYRDELGFREQLDTIHQEIKNENLPIDPVVEEIYRQVFEDSNVIIEKKQKTIYRLFPYLATAAAILLFLFIAYLKSNLFTSNTSPEELFVQYFEPFDLKGERSIDKGINIIEKEELSIEQQKDSLFKVSQFLIASDSILRVDSSNPNLTKLIKATIPTLKSVANSSYEYNQEANWYLGLVYLRLGNKGIADKYFNILVNENDFKAKESKILLESRY